MEKLASSLNPIARSAEQTVRLPVHKRVPSKSVRAFFQEGFEKSTAKGCSTDRMLCDIESMCAYRCLSTTNNMHSGVLSINFFVQFCEQR